MKKIQCEICGSTNIKKIKDSIFECQSCGVQYTTDDVKRLFVEIGGTVKIDGAVKIDKTDRIQNLYQLAEVDIDKTDCGNAQKYYEEIIVEEPTSWKAHFFIPYIKAWNSNHNEIITVANDFCGNYATVIRLIKENVNENEQLPAIKTVFERSSKLFDMLSRAITAVYNDELAWQPFIPSSPDLTDIYDAKCKKKNHDDAATQEMVYKKEIICKIMSTMGDVIHSTFQANAEINHFAIESWKEYVSQLSDISHFSETAKQGAISYSDKIKQYDPNYTFAPLVSPQATQTFFKGSIIGTILCALFPMTSLFVWPCLLLLYPMHKIKKENGGTLPPKEKKLLTISAFGFWFWILVFIIFMIILCA